MKGYIKMVKLPPLDMDQTVLDKLEYFKNRINQENHNEINDDDDDENILQRGITGHPARFSRIDGILSSWRLKLGESDAETLHKLRQESQDGNASLKVNYGDMLRLIKQDGSLDINDNRVEEKSGLIPTIVRSKTHDSFLPPLQDPPPTLSQKQKLKWYRETMYGSKKIPESNAIPKPAKSIIAPPQHINANVQFDEKANEKKGSDPVWLSRSRTQVNVKSRESRDSEPHQPVFKNKFLEYLNQRRDLTKQLHVRSNHLDIHSRSHDQRDPKEKFKSKGSSNNIKIPGINDYSNDDRRNVSHHVTTIINSSPTKAHNESSNVQRGLNETNATRGQSNDARGKTEVNNTERVPANRGPHHGKENIHDQKRKESKQEKNEKVKNTKAVGKSIETIHELEIRLEDKHTSNDKPKDTNIKVVKRENTFFAETKKDESPSRETSPAKSDSKSSHSRKQVQRPISGSPVPSWHSWRDVNDSYAYDDVKEYIADNDLMPKSKKERITAWSNDVGKYMSEIIKSSEAVRMNFFDI